MTEIREGAAQAEIIRQSGGELKIPPVITVREFAALANQPIAKILTTLMKNGVLASMNERIDFDTASIIGEELPSRLAGG
jgi:translation initiation factor IF-2